MVMLLEGDDRQHIVLMKKLWVMSVGNWIRLFFGRAQSLTLFTSPDFLLNFESVLS
jgi:hypothetical protein